jgi:hypothetical protein
MLARATTAGRVLALGARTTASAAAIVAALLSGIGWLYVLRGLGWFTIGPNVRDSLPLLQLAGFDVQPLGRVLVAWAAAGLVAGAALVRVPRLWRGVLIGTVGILLLLLASQASFALTRNLRLSDVVWSRSPGTGAWVEGLVFAAAAMLPGSIAWLPRRDGRGGRRPAP